MFKNSAPTHHTVPGPGLDIGSLSGGGAWTVKSCPKEQAARMALERHSWNQGTLDQRLPEGPGARGIFQGWAGSLWGLGRSAGVSDFLLKATETQRRASK